MPRRLRIGIIGLGQRWPRYRRALDGLAGELRAVAVHDPSPDRCERAAHELRAEPVGGVVELIERPDVEALLFTGGAWYGLWPLEQAARAGKPTLCAASPTEDEATLAALRGTVHQSSGIGVALWPALTRLRESLADRLRESLGSPLFVQMSWTRRREPAQEGDVLAAPEPLALLRECADLFGSAPEDLTALGTPELTSVILRFGQARAAQLTLWSGPAARTGCRVQVQAEGGAAWAELPRGVGWQDEYGRHHHELPAVPAEWVALARFAQAVREGAAPACSLGAACQALDWLRLARAERK